jgi:hypothetical protein
MELKGTKKRAPMLSARRAIVAPNGRFAAAGGGMRAPDSSWKLIMSASP